jgi:DNA-3-methyladenine glycosylase
MLTFELGTPVEIAKLLLGMTLTSHSPDGHVSVRITEVEAYAGEDDPASHASHGRTKRNGVMFGAGGVLYVYRSHGLHWCCNVVTGPVGVASAVLLRAGEVVEGHTVARQRRGLEVREPRLARGPGNLTQALGVGGSDNGASVTDGIRFSLTGESAPHESIVCGPRVGVSQAPDVHWRFAIPGPTVSAYRRSARAERR